MAKWRSSKLRRVLISILLSVLALAGGVATFLYLASLKEPPPIREPVEKIYNVEVFAVAPADLQEIISGFGTAAADRQVTLAAEVAGAIESVQPRLKIGRDVAPERVVIDAAGRSETLPADVLLQIDHKTYQEKVDQNQKRIAEARAELRQLEQEKTNLTEELEKTREDLKEYRREYERIEKLTKSGVLVESDLTQSRLELQRYELAVTRAKNQVELLPFREQQIKARIETHEADLRMARLDLGRTVVTPPFAGTLSEVFVERGQYVRPGDQLVQITDKSVVEVPVPLTLGDYSKIEAALRGVGRIGNPSHKSGETPGLLPPVALSVNETAEPRWFGRVVRAAPVADETTRTVNVFVRVENRDPPASADRAAGERAPEWGPLLPGTFVHARIDGPVLREVVAVPRDAIQHGRVFVAARRDDQATAPDGNGSPDKDTVLIAEERPVTVKRTLHSLALIETGLRPGEKVLLTNLDVVHSGAKVRIQAERALEDELQPRYVRDVSETLAGGGSNGDRAEAK